MVGRPRAGRDRVPADWRWVSSTRVLLRSGAFAASRRQRPGSPSNHIVHWPTPLPKGTYCEVQPLDRQGRDGGVLQASPPADAGHQTLDQFRACEQPGRLGQARRGETERAFWLRRPSWEALWQPAEALEAVKWPDARASPRPTLAQDRSR